MSVYDKYEPVIGLEVHCQLLTESKAYSSDSAEYGGLPNTQVGVITLAHPGTLPRTNKKVVECSIKMGLALNSTITRYNFYDRKNYFYPDLPKGYQITQDKTPICVGGKVLIKTSLGEKNIQLTRIHMEEDSGKSMHLSEETDTLIDLNRAGVALIEVVSDPDIKTSEEAGAYLTEIRKLVRYLDICDGNMEESSMRCDANVSVMLKGSTTFGKKVEVKNMNSIRNVQRAIEYEIKRQIDCIEAGEEIPSETRNFDANTGTTASMRSKEDLNDYRYFPEPDLQPVIISDEWIAAVKALMPALPNELIHKFIHVYGLPEYDAYQLTELKEFALYFETLCTFTTNYKAASNWMMGAVKSYLNELTMNIKDFPLLPTHLAELILLVDTNKVSNSAASQTIFPEMLNQKGKKSALQIAQELDLIQESNVDSLAELVVKALAMYPEKVTEYKAGKKGLLGLFMGEVMKLSGGKADPKISSELIRKALEV